MSRTSELFGRSSYMFCIRDTFNSLDYGTFFAVSFSEFSSNLIKALSRKHSVCYLGRFLFHNSLLLTEDTPRVLFSVHRWFFDEPLCRVLFRQYRIGLSATGSAFEVPHA